MSEIPDEYFDEARFLARQAGVPEERIDVLRVQALGSAAPVGDGSWTLMASAGEGTLELLLNRWLGDGSAEWLQQARGKPLVIGREPETLIDWPGGNRWTIYRHDKIRARGQLVVLTTNGAPSAKLSGELARFGQWNSAVVVTRASTPLPQGERDLIRALSKVAPVAKVLLLAIPGELPTAADKVKVEEHTRAKLVGSGFDGARNGGVWFWWLDGKVRSAHDVADPAELMVGDSHGVAVARILMLRSELVDFVSQVEQKALASGVKPLPSLSTDEVDEIETNFTKALTGVIRQAEDEFRDAVGATDARLRAFVIDRVAGWGQGTDLSGVWLRYVETVRPGAKAGLFEKVKSAAQPLSLALLVKRPVAGRRSDSSSSARTSSASGLRTNDSAWDHVLRLGVAAASRVGQWAVFAVGRRTKYSLSDYLLRIGVAVASGVGVALWVGSPGEMLGGFVTAIAAAGGALVGYVIGGPFVAGLRLLTPAPGSRYTPKDIVAPATEVIAADARIRNINLFERELTEWLSGHIRAEQVDVVARCRALIKRITNTEVGR